MRRAGTVQPIIGTPVGGEVRPLMDYIDNLKAQRSGMSKASQGLDANALQSKTASAISATVRGAQVKLESYARTMAETGVKDLFKGILHLVTSMTRNRVLFAFVITLCLSTLESGIASLTLWCRLAWVRLMTSKRLRSLRRLLASKSKS